ncbi:MAG: hypothetical protein ACRC7W_00470 [Fusobacteriaceae bacterium]
MDYIKSEDVLGEIMENIKKHLQEINRYWYKIAVIESDIKLETRNEILTFKSAQDFMKKCMFDFSDEKTYTTETALETYKNSKSCRDYINAAFKNKVIYKNKLITIEEFIEDRKEQLEYIDEMIDKDMRVYVPNPYLGDE